MSRPDPSAGGADPLPSADELQRAIGSVPGVTAAEVSRASNGRDRLRISLSPGEDPEALAWSVAAMLRERFGIALDPAAISARAIADPSDEPVRVISRVEPAPDGRAVPAWPVHAETDGGPRDPAEHTSSRPPTDTARAGGATSDRVTSARAPLGNDEPVTSARRNRAAISQLSAEPTGDDLDVTATLVLSGREAAGRARGVRTRRGRWRAISEATIDALGPLSADRVRGHVDHVTVLTYADLAHVSVSVTLLTDRGEETFLGAALVRDDPDRAVMRATLDAVNRRVEPWLAAAARGLSDAG